MGLFVQVETRFDKNCKEVRMKIAPLWLGAVVAQSGDDVDTEAGDERWGTDGLDWGNGNDYLLTGDSNTKYGAAETVQAVTCWESNNMGDLRHWRTQNDDGFGWGNIHHGHDQAADQADLESDDNPDYQVGTWFEEMDRNGQNNLDMHSVLAFDNRYSGCIYEVANWDYSATSYNTNWYVQYGWDGSAHDDSGEDDSVPGMIIRPNWWHYFNAHIVFDSTHSQAPFGYAKHLIAMANPSYEGLGFLNFIVTFARASSSEWTDVGDRGTVNHNVRSTVTDLFSGGYVFKIQPGIQGTDEYEWYSTYTSVSTTSGTWAAKPAISSFPHNDLGKDFRFNIRVLHKGGEGDPSAAGTKDSYYFYKINQIDITFPYTVRCPKEETHVNADGPTNTFRCMDSANFNGHRGWHKDVANTHQTDYEDENRRAYVETLENPSISLAGSNYCNSTPMADGTWFQCGVDYSVQGLMNTYDEFAQQEFGTHQEFWFQFYYHFEISVAGGGRDSEVDGFDPAITVVDVDTIASGRTPDYIYNFPNILFNAFELTHVSFTCNHDADLNFNTNRC